jgi:uncharacterized protein (TIGR02271 family)
VDAEGGHLSQEEERRVYEHYGLNYSERTSDSGLPTDTGPQTDGSTVGHDTSGPTTDEAMTRSEENVTIGTRDEERGRVRLRKWVETEHVTETVPVRKEKAVVEREPITDENIDQVADGPAISEEEHEVVLHEERPVVEKGGHPRGAGATGQDDRDRRAPGLRGRPQGADRGGGRRRRPTLTRRGQCWAGAPAVT